MAYNAEMLCFRWACFSLLLLEVSRQRTTAIPHGFSINFLTVSRFQWKKQYLFGRVPAKSNRAISRICRLVGRHNTTHTPPASYPVQPPYWRIRAHLNQRLFPSEICSDMRIKPLKHKAPQVVSFRDLPLP